MGVAKYGSKTFLTRTAGRLTAAVSGYLRQGLQLVRPSTGPGSRPVLKMVLSTPPGGRSVEPQGQPHRRGQAPGHGPEQLQQPQQPKPQLQHSQQPQMQPQQQSQQGAQGEVIGQAWPGRGGQPRYLRNYHACRHVCSAAMRMLFGSAGLRGGFKGRADLVMQLDGRQLPQVRARQSMRDGAFAAQLVLRRPGKSGPLGVDWPRWGWLRYGMEADGSLAGWGCMLCKC